jgi:hypothetical protein
MLVRFQVHTTGNMNTRAFWDIAPCSLVGVDRRFRSAYRLHHQGEELRFFLQLRIFWPCFTAWYWLQWLDSDLSPFLCLCDFTSRRSRTKLKINILKIPAKEGIETSKNFYKCFQNFHNILSDRNSYFQIPSRNFFNLIINVTLSVKFCLFDLHLFKPITISGEM